MSHEGSCSTGGPLSRPVSLSFCHLRFSLSEIIVFAKYLLPTFHMPVTASLKDQEMPIAFPVTLCDTTPSWKARHLPLGSRPHPSIPHCPSPPPPRELGLLHDFPLLTAPVPTRHETSSFLPVSDLSQVVPVPLMMVPEEVHLFLGDILLHPKSQAQT